MNADRELLEQAAKAAGIELEWFEVEVGDPDCDPGWYCDIKGTRRYWNPLTDDGDALRLAVKLRLTISWDRFDDSDYATATPPHTHQGYDCIVDQDPHAATRRAIVKAAAAIAKATGESK